MTLLFLKAQQPYNQNLILPGEKLDYKTKPTPSIFLEALIHKSSHLRGGWGCSSAITEYRNQIIELRQHINLRTNFCSQFSRALLPFSRV